MPRKRHKPEPDRDPDPEQELILYLEERANQAGDAPLTAEELTRATGDLEAAKRLAALKAERAARQS